jgi:putative intracellular protease/amidase
MHKVLIGLLVYLLASVAIAADRTSYTRNVAIVIYEDAEPLDWTGPYEVYNDAASFGTSEGKPAFNVYTVSKNATVLSSQGLKIVPDYTIANAPKPDIVIVPGGNSNNVQSDPEFLAWVKKAATEAEIGQTVCTGAFVFAKAGLLDKQAVTTWYGAIDHLRQTYPDLDVRNGSRFIDGGHIVTTAGISAGIDGSLHVVARLLGRRVADQVARYMEYHWTPEAYLTTTYAYYNPSTTPRGRLLQSADVERENNNFALAAQIYRTALLENPADNASWAALARTLRSLEDHKGAAEAFTKATGAYNAYQAAQEFAKAGDDDRAFESLQVAWKAGFKEIDSINREPAFARLRGDARFRTIVAQ